jgi:hypothetical protein
MVIPRFFFIAAVRLPAANGPTFLGHTVYAMHIGISDRHPFPDSRNPDARFFAHDVQPVSVPRRYALHGDTKVAPRIRRDSFFCAT